MAIIRRKSATAVKLRFLLGLTKKLCEITGVDAMPPVQIILGEMAAYAPSWTP